MTIGTTSSAADSCTAIASVYTEPLPNRRRRASCVDATGGGGWGDPLERPYAEVERDLRWGKVSLEGARTAYGVVASGGKDDVSIDVDGSEALRAQLRDQRDEQPFFDRGPGYARLADGAVASEYDWV